MKKIFSILFALIVASYATAQVNVESRIDSISILIGEQTRLTIDVTAKKNAKIKFPSFKPSQYITPGVEIVSVADGEPLSIENDKVKVSKILTLTSFDEKLYAIPKMKVSVDGKVYTTNTLALKVLTVDVDTLHADKFFPPKDVQTNPFSWEEWSTVFWLSVLMVILCCIAYYLFIRLKENKPIITHIRVVKRIPPHQKALNGINRLKAEKMVTSADQKTYYTQLTDTLRMYIEERFGFNAMEMTTDQIIFTLRKYGDQKMIDELKELFETADLVKFAKYSTLINENDMNLVNAMNFIDQTKIEGQPTVERIVPKLSEEEISSRRNTIVIKSILYSIAVLVVVILVYISYNVIQILD